MRIDLAESKLKKTLELIMAGKAETDKKQILDYISSLEKAVKEESRNKRYRTATGARYITGIISEYTKFLGKTKALIGKEDLESAAKECAEFARVLEEAGIMPKPGALKRLAKSIGLKFRTKEQAEAFSSFMANPMLAILPASYPGLSFATDEQAWWSLLILTSIHLIGRLIQYGLAEEKDREKYVKWLLIAFAMFAGVLFG